jgi:hypothetical protein
MRTVDYVSQIKEKTGSGQKVDEFPLVTYNTYLMILRIKGRYNRFTFSGKEKE